MPHAIEVYFDPATETAIRALWAALAKEGITSEMTSSPSRPHISLSVLNYASADDLQILVALCAAAHGPLSLSFGGWSRFDKTEVVYFAPRPSAELRAMQRSLHAELRRLDIPVWPYYDPAVWVPHCTVAMQSPMYESRAVDRIVRACPMPKIFSIEAIGLAGFPPVSLLKNSPLPPIPALA